jgi:hypothetical protein
MLRACGTVCVVGPDPPQPIMFLMMFVVEFFKFESKYIDL